MATSQAADGEGGDLNSLADPYEPNAKPPYPYVTIIRFAITGSPRQKLTLSELYESMEARFPYYKTAEDGWKVCKGVYQVQIPSALTAHPFFVYFRILCVIHSP